MLRALAVEDASRHQFQQILDNVANLDQLKNSRWEMPFRRTIKARAISPFYPCLPRARDNRTRQAIRPVPRLACNKRPAIHERATVAAHECGVAQKAASCLLRRSKAREKQDQNGPISLENLAPLSALHSAQSIQNPRRGNARKFGEHARRGVISQTLAWSAIEAQGDKRCFGLRHTGERFALRKMLPYQTIEIRNRSSLPGVEGG